MSDISDLRDTIVPKSDQLNADMLLAGPMTITVTAVQRGSADQPVVIRFEGDEGKPFKPCKTVRKILIFAWGENGEYWAGRRMTIFNDPKVKFSGQEVGGIRVSHLSDIKADISVSVAETKGKKTKISIKRLADITPAKPPSPAIDTAHAMGTLTTAAHAGTDFLVSAWKSTPQPIREALGGKCPDELKRIATDADNRPEPTQVPLPDDTEEVF